jgi:hypothetical protein
MTGAARQRDVSQPTRFWHTAPRPRAARAGCVTFSGRWHRGLAALRGAGSGACRAVLFSTQIPRNARQAKDQAGLPRLLESVLEPTRPLDTVLPALLAELAALSGRQAASVNEMLGPADDETPGRPAPRRGGQRSSMSATGHLHDRLRAGSRGRRQASEAPSLMHRVPRECTGLGTTD